MLLPCCLLRLSVLPGLPSVEGTALTPPLHSSCAASHLFSPCGWCLYVKYEGTAFDHPPFPGKAMAAQTARQAFQDLKSAGPAAEQSCTQRSQPHITAGDSTST